MSKAKYSSKRKTNHKGAPASKKSWHSDVSSDKEEKISGKSTNDPQWYAANPQVAKDAASMPFSWATGSAYDLENPLVPGKEYIPGICTIYLRPTVGWSDSPTSPLNMASLSHYSFVRHANSGHSNYDAPDLMLYICAVSQVYSYINFLCRTYGLASLYSYKNRYLPQAALTACRVDANNVCSNLANFRYGINLLIDRASSLAAPLDMSIYRRHAMLYANIYSEGSSIKDQLYMYCPHAFWQYGVDSSGAGSLTMKNYYTNTAYTVDQLLQFGFDLLEPLISDEDLGIMCGDIMKAYGQNIYKLAKLPEYYPIAPVYDPLVLEQFKNATIVDANTATIDIKQSANKAYLVSTPQIKIPQTNPMFFAAESYSENRILSTQAVSPDPATIMEISRLTVGTNCRTEQTDKYVDIYCGSEVAVLCRIWYFKSDGTLSSKYLSYMHPMQMNLEHYAKTSTDLYEDTYKLVALMSNFKYHPCVTPIGLDGETVVGVSKIFDVDNYTILSRQDIEKMHETALLNELYIPSIGKA